MNRHLDPEIEVERYELAEAAPLPVRARTPRVHAHLRCAWAAGCSCSRRCRERRAQESGARRQQAASNDVSAWVHIDEQGHVTGYTGKTEIGQNIRTSLAQAIADELRVPLDRVSLVMADTDLVPFDQGTFGSQSTPRMAPQLARAAAAAREMLIDRAAAQWNVERPTLALRDGRIVGQGRSAGFGELTKGQKLAGVGPCRRGAVTGRAVDAARNRCEEGGRRGVRDRPPSLHAGHHAAGDAVWAGHPARMATRARWRRWTTAAPARSPA